MSRLAILLVVAIMSVVPRPHAAWAQTVTNPRWIQPPDGHALAEYVPDFANAIGVRGRAVVKCRLLASGDFGPCDVVDEQPSGLGFGLAGVQVLMTGRLQPRMVDGEPVDGFISAPVNFDYYGHDDRTGPPATWRAPGEAAIQLAERMIENKPALSDDESLFPLGGLQADRRAVVLEWIDELTPASSAAEERRFTATLLAGFIDEDDLRAYVENGTRPRGGLPSLEDWLQACAMLSESFGWGEPIETLTDRYCERFGCEIDGVDARVQREDDQGSSSTSQYK